MIEIPRFALSVRQPWAYCLAVGWKPVENRSWHKPNPALKFRGPFAIHASTGMTRDEYADCADLCARLGFALPAPGDLLRGGIVGVATIVDIVREFDSRWFFGPCGLVIADARPADFIPVGGRLGFFDWRELLPYRKSDAPAPPAKWMLPRAGAPNPLSAAGMQGRLL
ncbi:hypothetical protein [Chelatococcus sp. XZ-Ab1]|uniref:hypothetical protein n=1 Tax=Chelatococcus sp. XZ-Ab1 TaxID=3034027 RepID=UPI0023E39136|nr:hypothetical protein [Chelatococcus sp. XZ-Ab1]